MKKEKALNIILPMLPIICILIIWAVSSKIINNEYILPSVWDTVKETVKLFSSGKFYLYLFNTVLRSLIAFAFSFSFAFLFAFISQNERGKKVITPVIAIMRALPTVAVVLLLLFWTNSFVASIAVTVLVVLPTLYTNIYSSLMGIDKKALQMCDVFNVDKKRQIQKVVMPEIMPSILLAIGSGLSLNLKLMVAAEVLSQTSKSLGFMLNSAKVYFEISKMIALVIVAVIIGIILEGLFTRLSKKAGIWQ